ncbi:MAG TPA: hypothetical protein DHW02_19170 [Ktedonobacter sp.]|nr:hypothetical protein [Ktedonobacter sp.]
MSASSSLSNPSTHPTWASLLPYTKRPWYRCIACLFCCYTGYLLPVFRSLLTFVFKKRLAQLRLLGQLREQGMLTEDEFQAEKQKILNGQ